jgi:hypothetical protein
VRGNTVKLSITVPSELVTEITNEADDAKLSRSAYVSLLLRFRHETRCHDCPIHPLKRTERETRREGERETKKEQEEGERGED